MLAPVKAVVSQLTTRIMMIKTKFAAFSSAGTPSASNWNMNLVKVIWSLPMKTNKSYSRMQEMKGSKKPEMKADY